jgi:serine/threonine-protein kinase RsbW/stage II sporulation protein AB (anti-sigma F factor)
MAQSTHEIERLELRTHATPAAVPGVRRAVVDFAELHGVGIAPDVALAVSEAITNAVLHAYRDGRNGDVRVVACAEPVRLVVVVRDYGCGMSPHPDSPGLGLGLAVIGRLATELNIERPDEGGGTRLRMCFTNA